MEAFSLRLEGLRCLDVGSSTGGFTDCMLQNGAARVYAIVVGYDLLEYRLRLDARVRVLEWTNARRLSLEQIDGVLADFASMDVSFISVKTVLPAVCSCLREEARLVLLIKPQFEAEKALVGKGGIVRDPQVHRAVLEDVLGFLPTIGLTPLGLTVSPIKGMDGNTEFLLLAGWRTKEPALAPDLAGVLEIAWK